MSSPLTSGADSGPDTPSGGPSSGGKAGGAPAPAPAAAAAGAGSSLARPLSPPGGPKSALRRRAAADHKESVRAARPASTRAAGAGGSSGTMMRLYTDENRGLMVDPVVVLVLSLGFILSVVLLHVVAKVWKRFA